MFLSHSSSLFGAERSLLTLLRNINNDIFEPHVVLPKKGELEKEIKKLNIKIHILKIPWWVGLEENSLLKFFSLLRCILLEIISSIKLCRIIKNEEIDIIYTNTITIISGAIAAYIVNIPHIWHIREIISGNPNLQFFLPNNTCLKFIAKRSNTIIANSNATAEQFHIFNIPYKLRIIYNAVDIEKFGLNRNKLKINNIKPIDWMVAVVGSLQKRKAQDDAIRAIKKVDRYIPNIKLLLIGDGNETYENYLKKLSVRLNISEKVIFTGYRNDIQKILPHCKVILIPSWNEPFGRVAIEAMAARVPVIGSNSGGIKEIIKDGITGYLVPPKSPDNIAEKLIYLFRNPNIVKDLGINGKKVATQKFNVESYVNNIEKVIQEIVKK
jgi:glycosyltransferase involved in cell wall biosynthesis